MTTERMDNFYLKSKVCLFEDACSHRAAIGHARVRTTECVEEMS